MLDIIKFTIYFLFFLIITVASFIKYVLIMKLIYTYQRKFGEKKKQKERGKKETPLISPVFHAVH